MYEGLTFNAEFLGSFGGYDRSFGIHYAAQGWAAGFVDFAGNTQHDRASNAQALDCAFRDSINQQTWLAIHFDRAHASSISLEAIGLFLGNAGPPVFVYEFAWKTPVFGGAWVLHAIDVPFVFGHPDYIKCWDDNDLPEVRAAADPHNDRYRLATQTMAAWTAFARSGNPSTPDLAWPAYDLTSRPTMVFDRKTLVVNNLRSNVRDAVFSF